MLILEENGTCKVDNIESCGFLALQVCSLLGATLLRSDKYVVDPVSNSMAGDELHRLGESWNLWSQVVNLNLLTVPHVAPSLLLTSNHPGSLQSD
jgi:hypothetical protein